MNDRTLLSLSIILGAAAMWLMLPRGKAPGRAAGVVLGAIALGLGASRLPGLGSWLADGMFWVLAAITVGLGRRGGDLPQPGLLCRLVRPVAVGGSRAVLVLRRPVSGGGHGRGLRRRDPGHVSVRAHAGPARGTRPMTA